MEMKKRNGMLRVGYGNKKILIWPDPLKNIEIQRYYQNETTFNGVYSRDNLPKNKGWGICNTS